MTTLLNSDEDTRTRNKRLTYLMIISTIVFLLIWLVGGKILDFMDNSTCYKYLGCNAGFFGYDSIVHLIGGMMEVIWTFWLISKHPRANIFHGSFRQNFWKNAFLVVCLVAFFGIAWELLEFTFDHIRLDILHENLRTPINRLAQPSNADTMGDISMGMMGAAIAVISFKFSTFIKDL